VSWREAVHRWRDYIRDSRETAAVFEGPGGDRVTGSSPNRFDPDYADKQYAKLKDLERGLRENWGKLLHTVMLTFTASSTTAEGDPVGPVDHLDDLTGSWDAVRRELNRVLDGREWEYLWILEPHESGYLHRHLAVFVKGPVEGGEFAPVIEAHLRNCEGAGRDAHDVADESTISVNRVANERNADEIGNLGTYLAEYLGTYGDDALEAPDQQQMANAVLWGTGKRRWQPSQGAQSYMATNRGGDVSLWEFVGIEDGDGEIHDAPSGGTVATIETATDVRRGEPPPDRGRG
jgi:hypothetical protein